MATDEPLGGKTEGPVKAAGRGLGLSWKLLFLTVLYVMVTAFLIYLPSISNFRMTWLHDRVALADAASALIADSNSIDVPRDIQDQILGAVGAVAIAIRTGPMSRLIATVEMPPEVDRTVDLRATEPLTEFVDALDTMLATAPRTVRVVGNARSGAAIELLINDRELRRAMVDFSINILWLAVLISLIVGGLLYFSINRLFVRPIRRMSDNMVAFSQAPENVDRIITPSGRDDEIGVAEDHLATMQRDLRTTLQQQRHLADLGLAVSKINHDLRNMLAAAQLFSDRLGSLPDPTVQRFAPKLIAALDRAIAYCQTTLAYGRAGEEKPSRRLVSLTRLVDDVADALGLIGHPTIEWVEKIPAGLEIDADPDQLFRVLVNLGRNAMQALEGDLGPAVVRRLTISASRTNGPRLDPDRGYRAGRSGKGPRPSLPGLPGRGAAWRHRPWSRDCSRDRSALMAGTSGSSRKAGPGAVFEIVIPDRPKEGMPD